MRGTVVYFSDKVTETFRYLLRPIVDLWLCMINKVVIVAQDISSIDETITNGRELNIDLSLKRWLIS